MPPSSHEKNFSCEVKSRNYFDTRSARRFQSRRQIFSSADMSSAGASTGITESVPKVVKGYDKAPEAPETACRTRSLAVVPTWILDAAPAPKRESARDLKLAPTQMHSGREDSNFSTSRLLKQRFRSLGNTLATLHSAIMNQVWKIFISRTR